LPLPTEATFEKTQPAGVRLWDALCVGLSPRRNPTWYTCFACSWLRALLFMSARLGQRMPWASGPLR